MRSLKKGQTVFELLFVVFGLIGLGTGFIYGSRWGMVAAIISGLFGAVVGYCAGFLPLVLCVFTFTQLEKRKKRKNVA